jgi:hypothetical protein
MPSNGPKYEPYYTGGVIGEQAMGMIVILNKRFLRSEGSGRAALSAAFFAAQQIARLARFHLALIQYRITDVPELLE